MKSVPEILKEIDRMINYNSRSGVLGQIHINDLSKLKEFILSDECDARGVILTPEHFDKLKSECEHNFEITEWLLYSAKDASRRHHICTKCKAYKIEEKSPCKHEWSVNTSHTTGPGTQTCLRCGIIR